MIRLDQPDTCAFCGRIIGPDEPKSGRGDAAAHVACADAALADDRFWDRIAAGMGDAGPAAPEPAATGTSAGKGDQPGTSGGTSGSGARSGCLLPIMLIVLAGVLAAAERGSALD